VHDALWIAASSHSLSKITNGEISKKGDSMRTVRQRVGDATIEVLTRVVNHPRVARRIFRDIVNGLGIASGRGRNEALDFLVFCQTNRAQANGQLLQDLWVLYETDAQKGGYFIEFGAVDGLAHSNTLLLERQFGWTGILAEPNQDMAAALHANRTAQIDMRCVWSVSGETVQLLVTDDPELATVDDRASEDIHSSVRRESSRRLSVETVSLTDLLDRHNAPAVIDYLSVDTEGTELEILTGFDWARRDIHLVSVEHNHRTDEATLDLLMYSKGYERRFSNFSNFDAWYRKK
jgi:FkbM family methyltransferase